MNVNVFRTYVCPICRTNFYIIYDEITNFYIATHIRKEIVECPNNGKAFIVTPEIVVIEYEKPTVDEPKS